MVIQISGLFHAYSIFLRFKEFAGKYALIGIQYLACLRAGIFYRCDRLRNLISVSLFSALLFVALLLFVTFHRSLHVWLFPSFVFCFLRRFPFIYVGVFKGFSSSRWFHLICLGGVYIRSGHGWKSTPDLGEVSFNLRQMEVMDPAAQTSTVSCITIPFFPLPLVFWCRTPSQPPFWSPHFKA